MFPASFFVFWTEVTMHLYRKFHARGGVRRVYATADKNWDAQTSFNVAWMKCGYLQRSDCISSRRLLDPLAKVWREQSPASETNLCP